jgi:hypothetical protein
MNPAFPRPSKPSYKQLFVLQLVVATVAMALVLFVNPTCVCAGDKPAAFETITLGVEFIAGSASESFGDMWDPSNGGLFRIDTPFYLGTAEVGVLVFNNNNLSSSVPPFRSVNFFLGWGFEWALPLRFAWFTGVRAGGFYMDFDDDEVADEVKTESELAFGLSTALRYQLGERWSVLASAQYLKVYTHHRIEYGFFGFGVSRTFTTPGGLREFLE